MLGACSLLSCSSLQRGQDRVVRRADSTLAARQVLEYMTAQNEAWPFREPVKAEEVPDYYTLVKVTRRACEPPPSCLCLSQRGRAFYAKVCAARARDARRGALVCLFFGVDQLVPSESSLLSNDWS